MVKNAYHIVTDLHDSDKDKSNRVSYSMEIDYAKTKLIEVCKKYKELGYDNYIILLGDVFDRGFSDPVYATLCNNFWVALNKKVNGIYSVVGNHELSFYKNNPFYTLLNEIHSDKLLQVYNRAYTPQGILQVFNVIDRLEDGEVVFHFNHYGTPLSYPEEGKINVGLYHQDILCNEILDDMSNSTDLEYYNTITPIDFSSSLIFNGFHYNFFGHLHKVFGQWELKDDKGFRSVIYYLASLGRPNVTEVSNSFLKRDIPTITVEDGKCTGMHNNYFNLLAREDCVLENVVEINKDKYKLRKTITRERDYIPVLDSPIESLRSRCLDNGNLTTILNDLLKAPYDSIGIDLKRKVGSILNGQFSRTT